MTTRRLAARLDRVSARVTVPEPDCRVDLNLLSGAEADRLVGLLYAFVADTASSEEAEELVCLLRASLKLTTDGKVPPPFLVPSSLQRYWRFQKFADAGGWLPGGNYTFNHLCFEDRERLLTLSNRYGWDPEGDTATISPLQEWDQDDLGELCDLLYQATSEQERRMWSHRHDPKQAGYI